MGELTAPEPDLEAKPEVSLDPGPDPGREMTEGNGREMTENSDEVVVEIEPGDANVASDVANGIAPQNPESEDSPGEERPIASEIATVTSENTLLATNKGGPKGEPKWIRLKKGMTVVPGYPIVCPPTFRASMTTVSGFEVTLVGPTEVVWIADAPGDSVLAVISGRLLIKANQADSRMDLMLGQERLTLEFPELGSVAAASVKHFRSPGKDPMVAENRTELASVLSVQGSVGLRAATSDEQLDTGQQWLKQGAADSSISAVDPVPPWIDPPASTTTSLAAGARGGLLDLLAGDPPLEIALREATLFRRSEVAALAAETLLHLGQGDVYFGSEGTLSQVKQRAYWPEHFLELLAVVDRSAAATAQLEKSIKKMDATNSPAIFRLLTGFSQTQLEEGEDQVLVDFLDSESMAVRVLALENLHRITGTTLYFRAEQDNAVRRAPGIKKWNVRLKKGDIRWPK